MKDTDLKKSNIFNEEENSELPDDLKSIFSAKTKNITIPLSENIVEHILNKHGGYTMESYITYLLKKDLPKSLAVAMGKSNYKALCKCIIKKLKVNIKDKDFMRNLKHKFLDVRYSDFSENIYNLIKEDYNISEDAKNTFINTIELKWEYADQLCKDILKDKDIAKLNNEYNEENEREEKFNKAMSNKNKLPRIFKYKIKDLHDALNFGFEIQGSLYGIEDDTFVSLNKDEYPSIEYIEESKIIEILIDVYYDTCNYKEDLEILDAVMNSLYGLCARSIMDFNKKNSHILKGIDLSYLLKPFLYLKKTYKEILDSPQEDLKDFISNTYSLYMILVSSLSKYLNENNSNDDDDEDDSKHTSVSVTRELLPPFSIIENMFEYHFEYSCLSHIRFYKNVEMYSHVKMYACTKDNSVVASWSDLSEKNRVFGVTKPGNKYLFVGYMSLTYLVYIAGKMELGIDGFKATVEASRIIGRIANKENDLMYLDYDENPRKLNNGKPLKYINKNRTDYKDALLDDIYRFREYVKEMTELPVSDNLKSYRKDIYRYINACHAGLDGKELLSEEFRRVFDGY